LIDLVDHAGCGGPFEAGTPGGSGGWPKQAEARLGSTGSMSTKCHCRVAL
jgi:hypothetical protein